MHFSIPDTTECTDSSGSSYTVLRIYFMNKHPDHADVNRTIWALFYQPEKIRARINSSFAYEDRKIQ